MHGELRMHGARRVFLKLTARDLAPGFFVKVGIQSRQHDRAVRKPRDRRKQLRRRGHRTGRACGDHGCIAASEALHLGVDELVAPIRGIDFANFT